MAKKEKAEKFIDITPKPEKITDAELNKLQSTVKTVDHLVVDIGQMELRKYSLMKAMEKIQDELEILRREFQENYGTDNINIQEGTINYPKENPNTEENGKTDKKD